MRSLTTEQRESLKTTLTARADFLRDRNSQALGQRADGTQGLANHNEETDDDAVADLEAFLDTASLERNGFELGEIMNALERLSTPAYGECTECQEIIPFARLQANPMATRCTTCQSIHERAHPAQGHPTL